MKLKTLVMLSAAAGAVAFSSCTKQTETTKSGVVVSYEKRGDEVFKDSSILLINMKYTTDSDSVIFDSEKDAGGPITIPYFPSKWDSTAVFYEVLSTLKVGDSAAFSINASEFFMKTFRRPVPAGIAAQSDIKFVLGVEDQMNTEEFEEYQMARMEKEQARMMEEQKALTEEQGVKIDSAIAANGLTAITTESGLRYVLAEEGTGAKPEAGQTVVVHYNGTLLDGTKFDSSYDRNQPFEFPIGQGRVIPGWDEGIGLLNIGSKATLYIPSALGYGPRGAGAVIKPNSILKFDVELLDVK